MRQHGFLFVLIFCLTHVDAQNLAPDFYSDAFNRYQKSVVKEEIRLVVNNTELLVGEDLKFAAYNLAVNQNEISELSSTGHVKLVDMSGKTIWSTVLHFKDGRAAGEYFVSSLLPTGNYFLIGYTNWMLNENDFSMVPLSIVNPFQGRKAQMTISLKPKRPSGLNFYPESGNVIVGASNKIVVTSFDEKGEVIRYQGQIQTTEGQDLAQFSIDEDGFAHFTLKPANQSSLKVILTSEDDQLVFQDFPVMPTQSLGLKVIQRGSQYVFRLLGEVQQTPFMLCYNNDGLIGIYSFEGERELVLSDLPGGLVRCVLIGQLGEEIASRLIFSGKERAELTLEYPQDLKVKSKGDVVIEGVKSSGLTISIRKTLSSKIEWVIRNLTYPIDALSEKRDHHLIANSWAGLTLKDVLGTERSKITILPEMRGQLIVGRIEPANESVVQLSVPGKYYYYRTYTTDESGRFYFSLDPSYEERTAYLQTEDPNVKIVIDEHLPNIQLPFVDQITEVDSKWIQEIINRSVQSQIENAYFLAKPDSLIASINQFVQFENVDHHYHLDDYTRFSSLQETIKEYVLGLAVRERNGEEQLVIRNYEDERQSIDNPLVLLDGVPMGASSILQIHASKMSDIKIINRRYVMGRQTYSAVVLFETIDHDMNDIRLGEEVMQLQIPAISQIRKEVVTSSNGAIPDYRNQLLWEPNFRTESGNSLEFLTSQSEGNYDLLISGWSEEGTWIEERALIKVEN
ncbi:MAG: hypothetical protein JXQ90_04190 [Cyclobacteriaceae bacterium]